MTRYQGGSAVARGWYVDTHHLRVVNLPAAGKLPARENGSFVRVPWPAMLLLAPWIGGAFILAAPVVGLAAAAWALARRAAGATVGRPGRHVGGRRQGARRAGP